MELIIKINIDTIYGTIYNLFMENSQINNQNESNNPINTSYSGQFKLRIPKSLHMQLAQQAKLEGVSMNQLCVYLLSQNLIIHKNQIKN